MERSKDLTVDPGYPQWAYMAVAFIGDDNGAKALFPLDHIYESKREVVSVLKINDEYIKKGNFKLFGALVYKIKLNRLIPHKKQYWENPVSDYKGQARTKMFLNMVTDPKLFQLLVVPRRFDKDFKIWKLAVAIPFYKGEDNKLIETFMMTSKEQVDITSKHSATYTLEKVFRIDWNSKTFVKVDKVLLEGEETLLN